MTKGKLKGLPPHTNDGSIDDYVKRCIAVAEAAQCCVEGEFNGTKFDVWPNHVEQVVQQWGTAREAKQACKTIKAFGEIK